MNRFADIDCSSKRLPPVYGFRSTKLVSIAKALQPIEPQISELNYYMKIAKKHCHFPNEHGLSKDQAAAVYIYTMEWGETTLYRVLNQALRADDRESLKIWFPYLKLFDTALDLLPTVKESVWRGIPLDIGDNFTKDQMLTWWAISSCSSSVGVIENFLKNETNSTLFLIEAVNGKKLSGYSQFDGEDEIILRIGSEFRVKANPLKRADGSHIVHLIEIDDNDDDDDDDDDEEEEEEEDDDDDQPVATAKNLALIREPLSELKGKDDVKILSTDNDNSSLVSDESVEDVEQYPSESMNEKKSKSSSDASVAEESANKMATIEVDIDDALKQMSNMMVKIYEIQENTIPRYLFILPAISYDLTSIDNDRKWFDLHFKAYFLCECSDDPKELHIASHDGYPIRNLREFIEKYGQYLQITLNLVKVFVSLGINTSTTIDNMNDKITIVQKFLDEPKIKQLFTSSSKQPINLQELIHYLDRHDLTQSLGKLHCIATLNGSMRWICQHHFDTISFKRNTELIKQIKVIDGKFNQEIKEITFNQVHFTNGSAKLLSEILTKSFSIQKLVFDNCSISEDDFNLLIEIIINRSTIYCLLIRNLNIFKYLGLTKSICNSMRIFFYNQLLAITFSGQNQSTNVQIFEKILSLDKIHRALCICASDFLRYERECQRYLDSYPSFTDFIFERVNHIETFNFLFKLKFDKLKRLKLTSSLEISSVANHFCQLLKTNQTIVELDLIDAIYLSDKDFLKNLFQTLKHHKSIKQLRLHISDIENAYEKETLLMNCLQYDRFLTHLCLSYSIISSELVDNLVDAIEKHRSLVHLEFYFCKLNENHVERLRKLENQGYLNHLVIARRARVLQNLLIDQTDAYLLSNLIWKKNAKTIAGGNKSGSGSNQFNNPQGIYIDQQEQSIYIADCRNHRIVKWKFGENSGQQVAGSYNYGDQIDRLQRPTNVILDKKKNSLIICDFGNRRVVRWSLVNQKDKEILISDIDCWGLAMNENGDLFVSDEKQNEVKRWKKNEKKGTVVAGGNDTGDQLNQFSGAGFIFVDRHETLYVSDTPNHRVMKWVKGAKEGIVVAGGHGKGSSFNQLDNPYGLAVNEVGDVYVADCNNHRIMCWSVGSKQGRVVVGGNHAGNEMNQFNQLRSLSFDRENNLYVTDLNNCRIQRFDVDRN